MFAAHICSLALYLCLDISAVDVVHTHHSDIALALITVCNEGEISADMRRQGKCEELRANAGGPVPVGIHARIASEGNAAG